MSDFLVIVLIAGSATWAFRVLPILLLRSEPHPGGILSRFLAATGPAAIATLFVASILPEFWPEPKQMAPLVAGVVAVVLTFLPRQSVVAATLAGAVAYGAVFAL